MDNLNILTEAKKVYTDQLLKILRPRIYEGFKSMYNDIIEESSNQLRETKIQKTSVIKLFQQALKDIPEWNQTIINREHTRIMTDSNCEDYFNDLIEAIFITNIKILTSVQINNNNSLNIKINIPQPSHFIHKCYIQCSKEIYKNPYIFDLSKDLNPKDKHTNLREGLKCIDIGVNNTISDFYQ